MRSVRRPRACARRAGTPSRSPAAGARPSTVPAQAHSRPVPRCPPPVEVERLSPSHASRIPCPAGSSRAGRPGRRSRSRSTPRGGSRTPRGGAHHHRPRVEQSMSPVVELRRSRTARRCCAGRGRHSSNEDLPYVPARRSSSTAATRRHTSRSSGMPACWKPSSWPLKNFSSTKLITGIRGSASCAVTQSQNAASVRASGGVEEADRRHFIDARHHDLAGHLVPVVALLEHVVVGIAAAHLRREAAALARQPAGSAGIAVARRCGRWPASR